MPKKEELIASEEREIFEIEEQMKKLSELTSGEFEPQVMARIKKKLIAEEEEHKYKLLELSTPATLLRSLRYQSLEIERGVLNELFGNGSVSEDVYWVYEVQLDLQLDALEYPEVARSKKGKLESLDPEREGFWRRISNVKGRLISKPKGALISNEIEFLRVRFEASMEVLTYLRRLHKHFDESPEAQSAIVLVVSEYEDHLKKNRKQYKKLLGEYPKLSEKYQEKYLLSILKVNK